MALSNSFSTVITRRRATRDLLFLALILYAAWPLHGQRISTYVDSNGQVVFHNDPFPVPTPAFRPQASRSSSGTQEYIASLIEQAATHHRMDPELIRAVVEVESNFNPTAVSPRGAMGLMQLIPGTARRFGVSNAFDPVENLDGGIRYLKFLMEMFDGDLELSLAAYNAGENAVVRSRGVPPIRETRNYLRKINGIYPLRPAQNEINASLRSREARIIVRTVSDDGIVRFTNTGQAVSR